MFTVTREWIEAQSVKGAWTSNQLLQVGISWPPMAGWKESLAGTTITDTQQYLIEQEHERRVLEIEAREKHRLQMERDEVMWTWPDGLGGFQFSRTKPEWWDDYKQPEGPLF